MKCNYCNGDVRIVETVTNAARIECLKCKQCGWIPIEEIEYPIFIALDVPKQLPLFNFDDEGQAYKHQFGME